MPLDFLDSQPRVRLLAKGSAIPRRSSIGPLNYVLLGRFLAIGASVLIGILAATNALALVVVLAAVFVGVAAFRPGLALGTFAALVPFESLVIFDEYGTITRLAGGLFAASYGVPHLLNLRYALLTPFGWGFLAWCLASGIWAVAPDRTVSELVRLVQLAGVCLLVADYVQKHPSAAFRVLHVYTAACAMTASLGIYNYLAPSYQLLGGRASAFTAQDGAQFAVVLVPAFIFVLHNAIARRTFATGWLALLMLLGIAILLSGTRSAWLAIGVVAILRIVPQFARRNRGPLLVAAALATLLWMQLPGAWALLESRSEDTLSSGGAGRLDIWKVGLTIYANYPLLGVGYGGFAEAFTPSVASDPILPLDNPVVVSFPRAPHSLIVGTLTELGPIGLLLLGGFIIAIFARKSSSEHGTVLLSILATLLLESLFLDMLYRKVFWLMLGLAIARGSSTSDTVRTDGTSRTTG